MKTLVKIEIGKTLDAVALEAVALAMVEDDMHSGFSDLNTI